MKICVSALLMATSSGKRKAGVGRQMIHVVDRLARVDLGHTYDIFIPEESDMPAEWEASPWVTWHKISTASAKNRGMWEHVKLAGESKRLGADVFFGAFVALPVLPTPPVVSVMHDAFSRTHADWFPRKQRFILDTMHAHAARKSRRVVTVSEWSKQQIHEAYKVPLERIIVAPNSVGNPIVRRSPEELAAVDLSELFDASRPYLFTLSTLEPRKNLVGLLKGFASHRKHFPEHQLVIAGARGWMDTEVFDLVKKLDLEPHVKFLGYVADDLIGAILQRADLFVLASMVEGFGIPVLEAMMAGAPVACSNTSAIPEVAGNDAFYFDPADPESIGATIQFALENPQTRAEYAVRGLVRAGTFTWDNTIQHVNRAFLEAAS